MIKSVRYIVVIILSMLVFSVANGKRINRDTAYQRALQFRGNSVMSRSGSGLTSTNSNSSNYYVFNYTNGGFVIVSSSDNTESILGYSATGSFNVNNLPDNFKYYLDNCDDYIEYVEKNNINTKSVKSRNNDSKSDIKPLIKSQWGQGYPYNHYCPEIDGQKCQTGCVATALAQIMAYHKFPDKGCNITYTDIATNIYHEIILDTCKIDYNKFLISYNGSETSEQIDAFAKFMKLCGTIVSMKYGVDASWAYTSGIYLRLTEYFDYDTDYSYIAKGIKQGDEWADSIYNSLKNNYPVVYEGGTHCWICDGYENGYYHMNWGWAGYCDGYFNLDAIYIGEKNYSWRSEAIINLHPKKIVTDKSESNFVPIINNITVSNNYVNIDIENNSLYDVNLKYGFISVNHNNDSVFRPKSNLDIESGNITTVSLNIDDVKNLTDNEICAVVPAVIQNDKYIPIINHTDTIYTINTPYKSLFVNSLSNVNNIIDTIYADNFKINKLPNNTIHIDAINKNYPVKIFDFGGTMIYCGSEAEITLPAPGFYVVKNGNVNKSLIVNN